VSTEDSIQTPLISLYELHPKKTRNLRKKKSTFIKKSEEKIYTEFHNYRVMRLQLNTFSKYHYQPKTLIINKCLLCNKTTHTCETGSISQTPYAFSVLQIKCKYVVNYIIDRDTFD